jgi:hypothetical protein
MLTGKRTRSILAALLFISVLLLSVTAQAATPLDEIESYVVTVDMRQDGTMDIRYDITWRVLNDTQEGPLTWVKIGIPNRHVDDMQSLSPTISDICYLDDGGSYVRADLDRAYHTGEVVSFSFSIHQTNMYMLNGDNETCSYYFVPGWFEETAVDSLKVRWKQDNVASSNATGSQDGYLTWESSLAPGERLDVNVSYPYGVFDTSQNTQGKEGSPLFQEIAFPILFIALAIYSTIKRYKGGFGSGTHTTTGYHHSCACASSCACACACACAGGGRAGCSAKNFYGANIQLNKLREKLQQNNEK